MVWKMAFVIGTCFARPEFELNNENNNVIYIKMNYKVFSLIPK
jgi:hypothetical protein